jgi:hypothetical protein
MNKAGKEVRAGTEEQFVAFEFAVRKSIWIQVATWTTFPHIANTLGLSIKRLAAAVETAENLASRRSSCACGWVRGVGLCRAHPCGRPRPRALGRPTLSAPVPLGTTTAATG